MHTDVRSVMTSKVVTVQPSDSLLHATRLFKQHGFKHLPVVDGKGGLVGVLTDRDAKRASASDATTLEVHELLYLVDKVTVGQVMTRSPITASPGTTVQEAAKTMIERKIGCLPVMEGAALRGILTRDDLLALVAGSGL